MEFLHTSVLLHECIEGLNINKNGVYIDGTCGGAGHSKHILNNLQNGRLYCFDKDPDAIKIINERIGNDEKVTIVNTDFRNISEICKSNDIYKKVDGVLLDLGVSSFQLDNDERGFSYNRDTLLDMRMTKTGFSAYDLINTYPASALIKIFMQYGEERFSKQIAFNLVKKRELSPIKTTYELVDIIKESIPLSKRFEGGHPAKRVFQAIRIAVNDELGSLKDGIEGAFNSLNSKGRLAIISFHSLEDRIVKTAFTKLATGCICPPEFPVCVCGQKPKGKIITKKPILPSQQELDNNKRSKSAKLRIIEKI